MLINLEHDPPAGMPLVVALTTPEDPGQAVGMAAAHLVHTAAPTQLALLAGDTLYDYHQRPGIAAVKDGRLSEASLPAIALYQCQDQAGRPFLLLYGPEPSMNWTTLADEIARLAHQLRIPMVMTLSALSWEAPHTRPVRIMCYGSNPLEVTRAGIPVQTARFPIVLTTLIEARLDGGGMPYLALLARVPRYLGNAQYPPAAVAMLRCTEQTLGLQLTLNGLEEGYDAVQLTRALTTFPQFSSVLAALEQSYDSEPDDEARQMALPSGEDLARQIEEYLADK